MMNSLVPANIVLLHCSPVPPPERYYGRAAVDLENLPSKGRHHALECFVARCKVRMARTVVLVRGDDRIVCPDFAHVIR